MRKLVLLLFCLSTSLFLIAQDDSGRPTLRHQLAPMQSYGVKDSPTDAYVQRLEASKTEVAPGLSLPTAGHVWALDKFGGQPQLVQLKYTVPTNNNHAASNVVKANLAPFIYKPRFTWELPGSAATVRLHDANPAMFLVRMSSDEDAADPATAQCGDLALIRLAVRDNKRIVATVAFTQLTGKAKRSDDVIETVLERFGKNGWYKLTPKQPLSPGEYALVQLPQRAYALGMQVFDFAIDFDAPGNSNAVLADSAEKD